VTTIIRKFTHEGKSYEIRAALDDTVWNVAIFEGGRRVGGTAKLRGDVRPAASSVQRLLHEAMAVLEDEFKRGRHFEIDIAIWPIIPDRDLNSVVKAK